MKLQTLVATLALILSNAPARAEVIDSAAGGFTVKISVIIKATPHDVYARVLHPSDWWASSHTFSGDAHNLTMDTGAAACFCEKLPNGGSVRHMDLVFIDPDKMLVLRGGLGPLQRIAANASMTMALTGVPEGTRLDVTFAAAGYHPQGMNSLAAPVDQVLSLQIGRLKSSFDTPAK